MRHILTLPVLLLSLAAVAAITTPAPAQTSGGGSDAATEFEDLRGDFVILYKSIKNSGGIIDEDKPTLDAFLTRTQAFVERFPDNVGGAAMELQLAKWLDYREQIGTCYKRLVDLRPDDARLAFSWLNEQESAADADEAKIAEAYEQLASRFPEDERVIVGWGTRLRNDARYADALTLLEKIDLDPAERPEAVSLLADCLFAEHRFEEALATLQSIPDTALQGDGKMAELKREVDRRLPVFEEYLTLWPAEQAIRQTEAEADDLPRVEITTAKGPVVVELYENEAPNTVANFITLAESGFYSQTKFHRFVPDFMIQGGDPNTKPDATGIPGQGNPGYFIPDEHFQDNVRNHFRDSLSMAKTGAPNSGGCQFFLNHRPTPWLNGKHTVFGRVIQGHDIARTLREDDEILMMRVLRKREHTYEANTLPLVSSAPKIPPANPVRIAPTGTPESVPVLTPVGTPTNPPTDPPDDSPDDSPDGDPGR